MIPRSQPILAPSGGGNGVSADDPYRVMVVDDSAVIRGLFARILEADPEVRVVASVGDGQMALNALRRNPEIELVVLDIEMPVMDGLAALPKLIEIDRDIQIIMASTLTKQNAEVSLRALSAGAADYIPKPTSRSEIHSSEDFKRELLAKVKALGTARRRIGGAPRATQHARPASLSSPSRPAAAPSGLSSSGPSSSGPSPAARAPAPARSGLAARAPAPKRVGEPAPVSPAAGKASAPITLRPAGTERPEILAIGSSTGGPQALFDVLGEIRKGRFPLPILITQHMPATFTTILAEHIGRVSGWPTAEAQDGEEVVAGRIYVAPGDYHMTVRKDGTRKLIRLLQTPPENFCRPAVDPMLRSLVEVYGRRLLVLILTGMGQDGLKGSRVVVEAGGTVIAQDEATSVVWGMPGAVANAGLCSAVLPVSEIGSHIRRFAESAAA